MIGAGVYYIDKDDGELTADWVKNSFKVWSKTSTGMPRGRRKEGADADPEDDYHGHFNAEKFEKWFRDICKEVKDTYGPAIIIMDTASYHRRRTDNVPKSTAKKPDLFDWLQRKRLIPRRAVAAKYSKGELWALVKENKSKFMKYATCDIARRYGHFVKFTPQYTPELQPIERVWGVIKNNIAASPCKTMAELMPRLRAVAEAKVTEAVWLGSLRKAQLKQKKFAAQPLEAEFSDAPEENEAGVATP